MLQVSNLDVFYGPVQALRGLDLVVNQGEVVTLVGANGAGKSTLLRAISGVVPSRGNIEFNGQSIAGKAPEEVIATGLAHVPEGRRIFPGLTVVENLQVAAYALGYPDRQIKADIDRVLEVFPNLANRARSYGWSLSGGEQQMLAIGRGLMARPRMLMLDEPSLGLAPRLVEEVFRIIAEISQKGTTILLVEQNATMALSMANRGYVLETGQVVHSGPAQELLHDEAVVAAYLGGH